MLESIGKAFSAMKQGAVEAGAKVYLNQKLGNFGSVKKLEINPTLRTMSIEVELKGEASPIAVQVGAYSVIDKGGDKFITLSDVRASREWIGLAVEQYVTGREFRIPDALSRLL